MPTKIFATSMGVLTNPLTPPSVRHWSDVNDAVLLGDRSRACWTRRQFNAGCRRHGVQCAWQRSRYTDSLQRQRHVFTTTDEQWRSQHAGLVILIQWNVRQLSIAVLSPLTAYKAAGPVSHWLWPPRTETGRFLKMGNRHSPPTKLGGLACLEKT